MPKFIGWLKRAKNLAAKGLAWTNKNIVKPILPAAKTVLEATGFGGVGKAIETGSNILDNILEKQGYKAKDDIGKYVKFGSEYLLDTQRLPSEKFNHRRTKTMNFETDDYKKDSRNFISQSPGKFKKLF